MPRKVFFSFHYERDVMRVSQIRKSWMIRPGSEAQPFLDKAEWEKVKRSQGVEDWIEKQLKGTSVTVVLIGAETASRKWVRHEIKRSYELGKGIIGIYIHNVKDPNKGCDTKGDNPFNGLYTTINGRKTEHSDLIPTYDWGKDDGYNNFAKWIEKAAKAAGY